MRALVLAIALLAAMVTAAGAQSTGSSMGSGSWGSSSGGSSGGYTSSSSSWSSDADCSDSGGGLAGLLIVIVSVLLYGVMMLFVGKSHRESFTPLPDPGDRAHVPRVPVSFTAQVDVSGLSLAIDARERQHLELELARVARAHDASTSTGTLAMLRDAANVLRRSRGAWLYISLMETRPMFRRDADQAFADMSEAASQGQGDAAGPGIAVLTILIEVQGDLGDMGAISSTEHVRAWFENLNYVNSATLVACRLIWSPAAGRGYTPFGLLETFPGMRKLRHGPATPSGECPRCRGHFPDGLVTCPHCSAPITDGEAA